LKYISKHTPDISAAAFSGESGKGEFADKKNEDINRQQQRTVTMSGTVAPTFVSPPEGYCVPVFWAPTARQQCAI
jgi:hypothetical protein